MQIPDSKPLSIRAYAKYRQARGLIGGYPSAVHRAVTDGRLGAAVRDGKIIDVELADRLWAENTDYTDAPNSVRAAADASKAPTIREGMSLNEASTVEKFWKALQAELKFKQDAGELVRKKEMTQRVAEAFTTCKTKLLGIVTRLRQEDPTLTAAQLGLVESVIRESLEDLSTEKL